MIKVLFAVSLSERCSDCCLDGHHEEELTFIWNEDAPVEINEDIELPEHVIGESGMYSCVEAYNTTGRPALLNSIQDAPSLTCLQWPLWNVASNQYYVRLVCIWLGKMLSQMLETLGTPARNGGETSYKVSAEVTFTKSVDYKPTWLNSEVL